MASNKKYWKSVEELNENSSIVASLEQNEFNEGQAPESFLGDKETLESSSTTRRDFLKYVGFTTAAASLVACEGPVVKSIPYVVKPEEITPGIANYYASTIADGFDFANVLVKTKEGRPIFILPNKEAKGTTNARVNASVLSLYDSLRLQGPKIKGNTASWSDVNGKITAQLEEISKSGEKIVFLTGTLASPSTDALIAEFSKKYNNVSHVVYDAISESAALDAFQEVYGERALPNYKLEDAKTIVSIGADFLGDWQGGGFEAAYAQGRDVKAGKFSRHIQFEANYSLTGANADKRVVLKPSEQSYALINLYNAITGENLPSKKTPGDAAIKQAATQLIKAGNKAVVITGIQDKNAQLIALAINNFLSSEILDVTNVKYTRAGNDTEVASLVTELKAGKVGALITYNTNPVYTLANAADFKAGLSKTKLTVGFSTKEDETLSEVQFALPIPSYLEAWGDVKITANQYSLTQPTIKPLFDTKQFQDCLLAWTGQTVSYYDYLAAFAKSEILGGASWNKTLHDGFAKVDVTSLNGNSIDAVNAAKALKAETKTGEFELTLFSSTALGDSQQANNPWLQELPDPLTRASWDNYLLMSQADADKLEFTNPVQDNGAINGQYATITVNGVKIENVPVLIQPGQAQGTIGLSYGYGKTKALKEEMKVGVNAYAVAFGGTQIASIVNTGEEHLFACEQLQHTIAGRHDILRETGLEDYIHGNAKEWNPRPEVSLKHESVDVTSVDLWEDHDRSIGHHFNLNIDLTSCTGCGSCVIACHAENNVPVVGKHEVRVGRDMHWLRIDRYYTSEGDAGSANKKINQASSIDQADVYVALETPEAINPQVAFQPIMCQHCNHAPCETVCPVAATSHGRQGQNQMAYNRCVGTRYCANNCPYRVRRFNWFKYNNNDEFDFNMNDDFGKMVLNPDVTVRSRGVMEKCSMCIQMTQATILQAKNEGRVIEANEFTTACSSACATGSIKFGDINNSEDEVTVLREDKRAYRLLEFIGTDNNVVYQTKIRNTNEA
ncbi:molybdopterin-containing oxidoreductase family iron-sulfur binding subunit [Wenyingzhuangia heitensis]|uniref:Molybdopterin-containing oxidoreductase family iron-sulfur binding subunit n=1 Tax=Wenyingzhuangia heitensis TaxID=1487859 RepID=A0ABX0UEL1_9FLAO|nr:TAT-variant-translocated molybdopterin oxidoreductase [Wenyingzhuangia heitensis]NIJ46325.1 molybdopterin-containing oxidoreductase family iron-sulfur binding subunit [Wenyingzhuangia heitensis]